MCLVFYPQVSQVYPTQGKNRLPHRHSSDNPEVKIGLTLSTIPSSSYLSFTEPFCIAVSAEVIQTARSESAITVTPRLMALDGLLTRAFNDIICLDDPEKKITTRYFGRSRLIGMRRIYETPEILSRFHRWVRAYRL